MQMPLGMPSVNRIFPKLEQLWTKLNAPAVEENILSSLLKNLVPGSVYHPLMPFIPKTCSAYALTSQVLSIGFE